MIEPVISAVSAAAAVMGSLSSLISSSRGKERALLMELKGNIQLLKNYMVHNLPEEKVISELGMDKLKEILESRFDFRKLNRKSLSSKEAGDSGFCRRYIGWSTERLFENVYLKMDELTKLTRIGYRGTNIRVSVRLRNLLTIMLLAAGHIK